MSSSITKGAATTGITFAASHLEYLIGSETEYNLPAKLGEDWQAVTVTDENEKEFYAAIGDDEDGAATIPLAHYFHSPSDTTVTDQRVHVTSTAAGSALPTFGWSDLPCMSLSVGLISAAAGGDGG